MFEYLRRTTGIDMHVVLSEQFPEILLHFQRHVSWI